MQAKTIEDTRVQEDWRTPCSVSSSSLSPLVSLSCPALNGETMGHKIALLLESSSVALWLTFNAFVSSHHRETNRRRWTVSIVACLLTRTEEREREDDSSWSGNRIVVYDFTSLWKWCHQIPIKSNLFRVIIAKLEAIGGNLPLVHFCLAIQGRAVKEVEGFIKDSWLPVNYNEEATRELETCFQQEERRAEISKEGR